MTPPAQDGVGGDVPVDPEEATAISGRRLGEGDTMRGRRVRGARPDPAMADGTAPRVAFVPDRDAPVDAYAARPALTDPIQQRAVPRRFVQPPMDGEAVDRALRGRARRSAVGLAVAVVAVVAAACTLLALVIVSFGH